MVPTETLSLGENASADSCSAGRSLTRAQRVLCFLVLAVTIFPLWYNLGNHPLYPRSEGRYASVSRNMLLHDHWLVPWYRGHRHLTKPLLAYWAQAGSMAWLGMNEWACRLPSAFAGTVVLALLFWFAWYVRDLRLAALSTGVLGMTPLFVVVSRLTLTDSLLNMFWFASLVFGYLAVVEPAGKRRGWFVVLLWLVQAGAWMTKGPLALLPLGVLVLWMLISGRRREIKKLWPVTGVVMSLVPIAAWVILVAVRDPAAWEIWYVQLVSRAVGTGAHAKEFWYFVPIFLGGLFPATVMMYLPGANFRLRQVWPWLRGGGPMVFWALAVVVPLLIFSMNTGKLASYILPLCAPLALITGHMLSGWLDGAFDHQPTSPRYPTGKVLLVGIISIGVIEALIGLIFGWAVAGDTGGAMTALIGGIAVAWFLEPRLDGPRGRVKPPEVVGAYFVCLTIAMAVILGLLIYRYHGRFVVGVIPMAAAIAAAAWMWRIWKRKPALRNVAMVVVFLAFMVNVGAAMELEDAILIPGSSKALMATIEKRTGLSHPIVLTYGYRDTTLGFYYDDWNESEGPGSLRKWLGQLNPDKLVVVAKTSQWKALEKAQPKLAGQFVRIFKWNKSLVAKHRWVLRPKAFAGK